MIVRFDECGCADGSLFKDMGAYRSVADWLIGIVDNKTNFHPLECAVKYKGEWFWVIENGYMSENADKVIKKIKRLPAKVCNIPNDSILIKADAFERELFINLDIEDYATVCRKLNTK